MVEADEEERFGLFSSPPSSPQEILAFSSLPTSFSSSPLRPPSHAPLLAPFLAPFSPRRTPFAPVPAWCRSPSPPPRLHLLPKGVTGAGRCPRAAAGPVGSPGLVPLGCSPALLGGAEPSGLGLPFSPSLFSPLLTCSEPPKPTPYLLGEAPQPQPWRQRNLLEAQKRRGHAAAAAAPRLLLAGLQQGDSSQGTRLLIASSLITEAN